MSTYAAIADILGDDAATALADWANRESLEVGLPAEPWTAGGYTGAALTMVYVTRPETGSRLVVVKRLPPEYAVEPDNHRLALSACPERFRPHLVEQLYAPLRTPGRRTLMFQAQAGESRAWRAMADLPTSALPGTCAAVTRGLITDWNPDVRVRAERAVDYLHGEVAHARSLGRQTGATGVLATERWIRTDEDAVMPNPLLLHRDHSLLKDVSIDLFEGRGHGDLHGQNVLVSQEVSGPERNKFVLVDLMTYRSRCPVDRDPVTLLLSALTRLLDDLSDRQRRLMLDAVVDPRHAPRDEIPPVVTSIVDAVYETADGLLRHCGHEAWHRQYLLSLISHGLVFSTFENLGPVRRWWFFRLAGHAGRMLVEELGVTRLPGRGRVVANPFPSPVRADAGLPELRGRGLLSDLRVRGLNLDGGKHGGGAQVSYPGWVKVEICRALYQDWSEVADYLDVPGYVKARFKADRPPSELWEWLEQRSRLDELAPALRALDLPKLADLLDENASS